MLIVGLTGSIGMGKSTAAARFRALGIGVFDADAKVHELYDGLLSEEIEQVFPGTVRNGKVDRQKLSAALLAAPETIKKLEAIVHPRVRAAEREFLHEQFELGARIAVLEIPLLFESDGDMLVDAVVVVSAPAAVQKARVLGRPGMSLEKLERLLQRQMPDEEKRRRADFIVDTSGSVQACDAQVDAIVKSIAARQGGAFKRCWR